MRLKKNTNQPKLKKNSTAYEVSDIKNVEWHTEYEKLHFYIFLTIITLCKRAIRRLLLDVQQNKRQDPKIEDVGLRNTGVPSAKRDAILHCILEGKEGKKYRLH